MPLWMCLQERELYTMLKSRLTCTVFPVPMSSAMSALPLCLKANLTPSFWKLHRRSLSSTCIPEPEDRMCACWAWSARQQYPTFHSLRTLSD